MIDCMDSDCSWTSACAEDCSVAWDEDNDWNPDCADSDCTTWPWWIACENVEITCSWDWVFVEQL